MAVAAPGHMMQAFWHYGHLMQQERIYAGRLPVWFGSFWLLKYETQEQSKRGLWIGRFFFVVANFGKLNERTRSHLNAIGKHQEREDSLKELWNQQQAKQERHPDFQLEMLEIIWGQNPQGNPNEPKGKSTDKSWPSSRSLGDMTYHLQGALRRFEKGSSWCRGGRLCDLAPSFGSS